MSASGNYTSSLQKLLEFQYKLLSKYSSDI
jgi:hypothetical protein